LQKKQKVISTFVDIWSSTAAWWSVVASKDP